MKQEMQLFDSTENPSPNIIKLCDALKIISPTSVEAERAFSAAGLFVTKLRARLSDKSATETSRNVTARVIERDTSGEIYYFLEDQEGSELANMVATDAKIVAKNNANLALPPRFRQVLIESPIITLSSDLATDYLLQRNRRELTGIDPSRNSRNAILRSVEFRSQSNQSRIFLRVDCEDDAFLESCEAC
ncbi:hypothetical protein TNCV_4988661 [Trichonephila clavipes]|nr:hypothetical protein TNCV_4988661 [Trichonephila clavipes]